MEEVLKVHSHDKLTYKNLLVFIKIWMEGEWDLFLTIKDWVEVDYESRKQHLDSLMSHVRFSLLTPAQLKSVKKLKMYSIGSWKNNVLLGEDYHSRPMHKQMMRPTSVRSKPQVVCLEDQDASSIFALEEDGKWTEIDVPDLPQVYKVSAMIEFNNFMVIATADDDFTTPDDVCDPAWHVFDVSTLKWSKMTSMKRHVTNFALVHDDRYIYALGGNAKLRGHETEDKAVDTIERYDPGSNTWTVMKTKLPGPLCRHSACVCSGPFFSIYVAGGWERLSYKGNYSYSSAMSCFNPYEESATWHKKAPMLIANESYVMQEMAFCGKDPAIVIMCANLVIQYYDLKTNQWSLSKALAHPDVRWGWHKNGTVLADPSENTLYVLNICEHFPGTKKNPKEGACAKWPLGKLNDTIVGSPVDKYPILTGCWGDCVCAAANYATAVLAIPATSKRMSNPPFGKKVIHKAKRPTQRKWWQP